jgi:ABC-2 type transport system permease protein
MRIYCTLLRRELAALFLSVTGYIIIAAVTLLIGLSFEVLVTNLSGDKDPTPVTVTEMFYDTFFFWLIVLVAGPVITMRLFALEKSTGTYETLMTTPVSDLEVVAAKFSAALVFYLILWLPLLACLFFIGRYTNEPGALDAGTVGGTYLGIMLVGGLFLSLGCFASAISRTQMTAAILSFVLGVTLFALGFLAKAIPVTSQWQTSVLSFFGLFDQMKDFVRGVVDTRAVIFYLSLTLVFLFLTLRVVESRRWK